MTPGSENESFYFVFPLMFKAPSITLLNLITVLPLLDYPVLQVISDAATELL